VNLYAFCSVLLWAVGNRAPQPMGNWERDLESSYLVRWSARNGAFWHPESGVKQRLMTLPVTHREWGTVLHSLSLTEVPRLVVLRAQPRRPLQDDSVLSVRAMALMRIDPSPLTETGPSVRSMWQ